MVRELIMLIFSVYMITLILIADITEAAKRDTKQKVVIVPRGRGYWPRKTKEHKDTVLSLFVVWIATLFIAWDPSIPVWLLIALAATIPIMVVMVNKD
jgi:hypothetical protein